MRTLTDIHAGLKALNVDLCVSRITLLAQGFSSDNYLVDANGQQYVLKFAHKPLIASQIAIQDKLFKLAITPEVIAYDVEKGLQLSVFWPASSSCTSNHIDTIVSLLSLLHPMPHNSECMDFRAKFEQYRGLAQYKKHRQLIAQLLKQLAGFTKHQGFCHNDLVLENMLQYQDQVKLIDFEYASNNDVFFDLASVSSSLLLNDAQKKQLLSRYMAQTQLNISEQEAWNKLDCFQLAYDFLCYFWYLSHQQPTLAADVFHQLISPKMKQLQ